VHIKRLITQSTSIDSMSVTTTAGWRN